jgi:hypothetical protein
MSSLACAGASLWSCLNSDCSCSRLLSWTTGHGNDGCCWSARTERGLVSWNLSGGRRTSHEDRRIGFAETVRLAELSGVAAAHQLTVVISSSSRHRSREERKRSSVRPSLAFEMDAALIVGWMSASLQSVEKNKCVKTWPCQT